MSETLADVDFRAAFALLPQVLKISKSIQAKQNEPQKQQAQIQTAILMADDFEPMFYMPIFIKINENVAELQAQLQHCHQLLSAYPCLDSNPEEQKLSLEVSQEKLRHKCELLLKYKKLEVFNM